MSRAANQPSSTTSNHNLAKDVKASAKNPRKNKFIKSKGKGRKTDKKQNALINKLSEQVYQLQMAKWGKVQMNYQTMTEPLIPTTDAPITFDLLDISCMRTNAGGTLTHSGCRFYQPAATTNFTNILNNVFRVNSTQLTNNPYWKNVNLDSVDTGGYFLDSVRYFFNIKGRPNLDDTRVRIDIISQRPGTVDSKTIPTGPTGLSTPVVLPWSISHFRALTGSTNNRINNLYFKKYMSKTFYLNSTPAAGSGVHPTTSNSQNWSFTIKPKRPILQKKTDPLFTPGLPAGPNTFDSPYGPDNISSYLSPLHCIISTDDITASVGDQVNVTVSRRCVFRDMMGSALLTEDI